MTVPVNSRATQFSAVLHPLAGNVSIGYAVTLDAVGAGYVVATTEALAVSYSGVIEGVVLQAGTGGHAIEIQSDARIQATYVPFVGTGNMMDFANLDATGRVVRSQLQTTTSIGRCARDGSVTLDLALQHAFTPTSVANLEFWLAADLGAFSGTSWPDQSGKGRHATNADATLATKVANVQNGRPGIKIENSAGMTMGNLSASFPSAATLFVVAQGIGATETYNFFRTKNGTDGYFRFSSGAGYQDAFRSARLEVYPASVPLGCHLWEIRSSASGYEVLIDGVSQGVQAAAYHAGDNYAISPLVIGGGAPSNTYIHELFAYSRLTTSPESSEIASSMKAKWGTP